MCFHLVSCYSTDVCDANVAWYFEGTFPVTAVSVEVGNYTTVQELGVVTNPNLLQKHVYVVLSENWRQTEVICYVRKVT